MNLERWRNKWYDELSKVLTDGAEYTIFLVAAGEKNGALSMNVTEEAVQKIKEVADEEDLDVRVSGGRVSKPSRTVGENPEFNQAGAFISSDQERFEMLDDGRFYGYSDQSMGQFLGFPEEAIEFFRNEELPAMESRKWIEEHSDKFEDLELLGLVSYVPPPHKESVERAIQTGRERKAMLKKFGEFGERVLSERTDSTMYPNG